MAQVTNLNIAPYYDDFDASDDFHRVLFRPGFAIQARELTTLQSILQNQIEKHGQHMFKEGTVVIPGQVSYSDSYYSLKLESTFAEEQIQLSQYINYNEPVIVTGETTGVQAKIYGASRATAGRQPYLYGDIIKAGNDNVTVKFKNGENLSVNIATQHTTSYSAGEASLKAYTEANPRLSCSQIGSAVTVEEGVYFVRGQFVRNKKQVMVLSPNSNKFSAKVGFVILEKLETPEDDTSLTDNATGSSNYAAKGAHRLRLRLRLKKIPLNAPVPSNFVELIQIKQGQIVKKAATTQYSVIGDELARRTFDESGDYTTKPFTFKVQEQIDNEYKGRTYKGIYGVTTGGNVITDDNLLASENLLNLQVSSGKAYVKGYEIAKVSNTNLTIPKARALKNVNAGVSTFNVGNFVNITKVFGMPDIGNITGETTPYGQVLLAKNFVGDHRLTTHTISDGDNGGLGKLIGAARVRTIEYKSGTQGIADAIYKLFLFDVRMFTYLTLSSSVDGSILSNFSTGGVQITGVTSGATGFLFFENPNSTSSVHRTTFNTDGFQNQSRLVLTNVVGNFQVGEKLKASDSAETDKILEGPAARDAVSAGETVLIPAAAAGDVDITVTQVDTHKFEEARSIFQARKGSTDGRAEFSADFVLALVDSDGKFLLDGTDTNALDEFDKLTNTGDDAGDSIVYETQRVAKLIEPEKNISIFKMPKNIIRTLLTTKNDGASDTQFTVRRQFVGTTNTAGSVSFTATGTNETFVGFSDRDFMCTIVSAGTGTGSAGDVVSFRSGDAITGTGSSTITITSSEFGSGAKVRVMATILRTGVATKQKTTNLCKQVKVLATDDDGPYGTRATDREISLGRADAYKIIAVYDSESTSSDATVPSMTLTSITGTFERGERIVGDSSGAAARIITSTSPMSYSLIGNAGAQDFVTGEVITGAASKATAVVGVLTAGSKVITSNFTLDTGQRDNFYDIARLVRKRGVPTPLGRLHIVFDYLAHGSGDLFSVDSYSAVAGQMDYDNIPVYAATKVDPDAPEPTGTFPLRDCFDFRPTVENIAGTSETVTVVDQITANSFNFEARQFDGVGAVVVDSPKPATAIQADFEYFIGYRASLYLAKNGQFIIKFGVADEIPQKPADVADALKLCSVSVPPYTFTPLDVKIQRFKTQRFTMRDIGRLKDRVERLEDITTLSILEQSAESFEIQDQNGLNRFKSGFVVDNFKGHTVGDVLNQDYSCAVDIVKGELRPKCVMRSVDLVESVSTEAAREAAGYKKTGDLITLPYVEQLFIDQPFGTNIENVQPYATPSWIGNIELIPSGDDWIETETAPTLNVTAMGTYDTVLAEKVDSLGTFWNAWEIVSTGVTTDSDQEWVTTSSDAYGFTETLVQTSIDTTTINKVRTGVTNTVVEDIVTTSNTAISTSMIPFVRTRKIKFVGQCFMPNKRVYAFFDGVDVNSFTEPLNSDYTSQTLDTSTPSSGSAVSKANFGKALITNSVGKIEGFFTIPDHKFPGQENVPKFETQKSLEFRLTSSPTNDKLGFGGVMIAASTAGVTNYEAVGILEVTQDTITATKNGKFVQTSIDDSTVVTEVGAAYTTNLSSHYTSTYVPPVTNYNVVANDDEEENYFPDQPSQGSTFTNVVGSCYNTTGFDAAAFVASGGLSISSPDSSQLNHPEWGLSAGTAFAADDTYSSFADNTSWNQSAYNQSTGIDNEEEDEDWGYVADTYTGNWQDAPNADKQLEEFLDAGVDYGLATAAIAQNNAKTYDDTEFFDVFNTDLSSSYSYDDEDDGGGSDSGGSSGGGGSSCVIATHGVSTGGFSLMDKAKAEIWCEKTYHGKWYGEAFRRGYRYLGSKAVERGDAHKYYTEFKDFVACGRGLKKGFKLRLNYYLRTIQFFVVGIFVREK